MITLNIKLKFTDQEYADLVAEFGKGLQVPATQENIELFLSETIQAMFSVRAK